MTGSLVERETVKVRTFQARPAGLKDLEQKELMKMNELQEKQTEE